MTRRVSAQAAGARVDPFGGTPRAHATAAPPSTCPEFDPLWQGERQGEIDDTTGRRVSRGDARAQQFDQLYRDTFQQVYAYCLRRVDKRDDADDIVAEVFASAWRRIDDVLAADSPLAWIYGIAYRVVGNHHRSRTRAGRLAARLKHQPKPKVSDPHDELANRERLVAAGRALEALQPLDRELVRLSVWEELSHAEIGKVIGLDQAQVRSRLYRARKRLRGELEDLEARDTGPVPDTNELETGKSERTKSTRRHVDGRTEGTSR